MKSIEQLHAGNILVATGNPGMVMSADGSGEQFHLSKDRPMVVFDPEGPFDDIQIYPRMDRCLICEERDVLEWSGSEEGRMGEATYLFECLGCGTVFNPADDI